MRTLPTALLLASLSTLGLASCTESSADEESSASDASSSTGSTTSASGESSSSAGSESESSTQGESTGDGDGDSQTTGESTGDGDGDTGGPTLDEVNVYLSGHSLFNLEMPRLLSQIAAAQGKTHRYNLQMGIGSNMSWRLTGQGNEQERDGNPIDYDVADEIAQANTIDSTHYDTLMVTEAVDIFDQLLFADTLPSLSTYYGMLVNTVPDARVFFYDSWDSIEEGGGSPTAWVAHTRDEYEIWRCIILAMNEDPSRATNPIRAIPGGVLLADVVEAAEAGEVEGLSATALFSTDGHHLSPTGNYVIALGQYAMLYGESVAGAPAQLDGLNQPLDISAGTAQDLQAAVDASIADFRISSAPPPTVNGCNTELKTHCETVACETQIDDWF